MACEFCKGYKHKNGFWLEGDKLYADDSFGEYDEVVMEINYCPLCGMRLSDEQERPLTNTHGQARGVV